MLRHKKFPYSTLLCCNQEVQTEEGRPQTPASVHLGRMKPPSSSTHTHTHTITSGFSPGWEKVGGMKWFRLGEYNFTVFSQNIGKSFSELKLVTDNLLFIYVEANWEGTDKM